MHEYSLAASLLKIILAEAEKHQAKITQAQIAIGVLTGIEFRTFTACFELIAEGTRAEEAKLELQPVPAQAQCTCGHKFELFKVGACPRCGELELTIQGGRDFTLLTLQGEGDL